MCVLSSQDLFLAKPSVIPPFGIRNREAIEDLNIDMGQIAKFTFPRTPPWTYEPVFVDWRMSYNCKDETSPTVFRAEYHRIKFKYDHHVYMNLNLNLNLKSLLLSIQSTLETTAIK